jgi:hypothetical protein
VNAILGTSYLHGSEITQPLPGRYTPEQFEDMITHPEKFPGLVSRQTDGDTTYITVTPKDLPLFGPIRHAASTTHTTALVTPILDLIQPATRLIDLGYDRTVPYGQPTPAGLFPAINPIRLAVDLGAAAGQGLAQALNDLGIGVRRGPGDDVNRRAVDAVRSASKPCDSVDGER